MAWNERWNFDRLAIRLATDTLAFAPSDALCSLKLEIAERAWKADAGVGKATTSQELARIKEAWQASTLRRELLGENEDA